MNAFSNALVPIVVLIVIGYGLKRIKFLPEASWVGMEKLTYFVLFPALIIRSLGTQTLGGVPWPSMLVVITGTLMTSAVVLITIHHIHPSETGATFTSIFQGGVRFNAYITMTAVQGMFGTEGLALGSVAAGFMIILINLLCIFAFAVWGKTVFRGVMSVIRTISGNPLILACVIGWFLSLSGVGLPGMTEDILGILGRAALPLGLLAVGAALKPGMMHGHVGPMTMSSIVQLGLKPLTTALLISFTGLTGVAAGVLLIAFMTPTAPSSYILARQLGGDAETMASIITFQTLLAFFMMPLIALILLG